MFLSWRKNLSDLLQTLALIIHIMKYSLFFFSLLFFRVDAYSQSTAPLKISPDQRYITHQNGQPFFWLGDTAWQRDQRTDTEEADLYLENRAAKGFTVIQAVVVAELEGLNVLSSLGEKPLHINDPGHPNEAYFQHVDYIINKANKLGMYI